MISMRVLYVGGSGNWEAHHYKSEEEKQEDITRRISSFKQMLGTYFSEVKTIKSEAYNEKMSQDFDVTIIDDYIKPLKMRETIRDSSGQIISDIPTSFFTKELTKPVLFIGQYGSMTTSLGSKIDWYCKCMDAHAFNYNKEHPIFNEPFQVSIKTEKRPTPQNAYNFEHFFDPTVSDSLYMWRVQTKGYKTDKGFRVGMVSRPGGFNDSPEAESISSGVCSMRNFNAVAIGRHGNFFHWGFAASPEYMTNDAKNVLANAICYISKFDGKGIIAQKRSGHHVTRGQYFRELIYFLSKDVYHRQLNATRGFDKTMLKSKEIAEKKKENNEALTDREKRSLNYKTKPEKTYADFLKEHHGVALFSQFGTHAEAYKNYYYSNKDYFYGKPFSYHLYLDKDVKSLKTPNSDKDLLNQCISMLENKKDVNKANRILRRYTLLNFKTANQWRQWYENNKEALFFTEAGGFKFMVNTYDNNVKGNHYESKKESLQIQTPSQEISPLETDRLNPVTVATGIIKKADGKQEVVIKIKIHEGYHLYAYVSDEDPYIATEVTINLPKGYSKVGAFKKPSYAYYNETGTTAYTGDIVFTQEIEGNSDGKAICYLTWQTCEADFCLPPVFNKLFEIELS